MNFISHMSIGVLYMMNKNTFKLIFVFIFLILSIGVVYAGANNTTHQPTVIDDLPDGEEITALEDGHYNTSFTNDYYGYCIEYGEQEAKKGDKFIGVDTSYLSNNHNDEEVSKYIKTYFLRYYDYAMSDKIVTQHMIWHFTDNFDGWRLNYTIINDIKENPLSVPDEGVFKYSDNCYLKYDFKVLLASLTHHQNYFVYKILKFNDTGKLNLTNNLSSNNTLNVILGNNLSMNVSEQLNVYVNEDIVYGEEDNNVNKSILKENDKRTGNSIKILTITLMILIVTVLAVKDFKKNR